MRRHRIARFATAALLLSLGALAVACSEEPDAGGDDGAWPAVALTAVGKPPPLLSTTGLARLENGALVYHPDLVPYELNMPLFSDYALKRRAFWVPPGKTIGWRPDGTLDFPEGSIIVKSFLFAADFREPEKNVRAIETRVLVRGAEDWKAWPYIWDATTGDATLEVGGHVETIAFVDPEGQPREASYLVPQRNQCLDCHDQLREDEPHTTIIGPKARLLNRDNVYGGETVNQLEHFQKLGLLPDLPPIAQVDRATSYDEIRATGVANLTGEALTRAARDYLDINCAHCHSPAGVEGNTSQLFLHHDQDNPFLYGVCKAPSSAGKGGFGRKYDVVPGKPDDSILMYRLETTTLGAMMPDIGRSLEHTLGSQLIRKWIEELPPVQCNR